MSFLDKLLGRKAPAPNPAHPHWPIYRLRWVTNERPNTPGAYAFSYEGDNFWHYDRLGGGKQVLGQLFTTQGAMLIDPNPGHKLAGLGGLQTGQIIGQPLVDPSA